MFGLNIGKYKSIVVSIALFIILDASVLLLNFYISFEIAEDAVGVNLAGRQRMLSQRMVKSLLDMEVSQDSESERREAFEELSFTVSLFDETLTAFDKGGVAKGAGGGEVELGKVDSHSGREAIESAKELWGPYKVLLSELLAENSIDGQEISLANTIVYGKRNNLKILTLMNDLTVDLENVARSKAIRLRLIQTVGISLAIVNFFIILFHFVGELSRGDRRLELARGETKKIMDTVNEGLFLVDRDYKIASQHSMKVSSMFGKEDISGYSIETLLGDLVNSKDMETSKRFIGLLFRDDIKSSLIKDLNPLKEIEVNISDDLGGYVSKYLSFDFTRAYEEDEVKNILVTVNDITEKVRLEHELASVREQTEQQLEVLTGILHANPVILKKFVADCFEGFHRINVFLREPAKSESALRKKLGDIFVEIHNFKGEAGALGLESFQDLAHKFEMDIKDIGSRQKISGDDFFPLVVQLDKLIRHAETVQNLSGKLAAFAGVETTSVPIAGEWSHLTNLADTVAERNDKKVELITSGLSEISLDQELKKLVSEVSVQCIRNAIVHGIETPKERLHNYKQETGRIDLRLVKMNDGTLELSIKDDGGGFDYDAIRAQAIASGLWSEQEMESWDTKKLVSLIFEPGFSTVEETDLDAGQGVGMVVIKEKIMRYRGKIRISSRAGSNTHFLISIPPVLSERVAA